MANWGHAVRLEPSRRAKVGKSLISFLFCSGEWWWLAHPTAEQAVPSFRLPARALLFLALRGECGGHGAVLSDLDRSWSRWAADRGASGRELALMGLLGELHGDSLALSTDSDCGWARDGKGLGAGLACWWFGEYGETDKGCDGGGLPEPPSREAESKLSRPESENRLGEIFKLATLLFKFVTYCCKVLKKLISM